MTSATDILRDAFERVHDDLPEILSGLTSEEVLWRPDPDANSIGWLIWHLSRIQDDHLAGVGGVEQAWIGGGWCGRFGLPFDEHDHGYGHSSEQVGAFSVGDADLLVGYHDAVHHLTMEVLAGLDDAGYERIVDDRWDPPVTAAVRLVSVVNDISQHLGQAAYVAGLAERSE